MTPTLATRQKAWHRFRRNPLLPIDSWVRSWLLDNNSLTERLVTQTQGQFSVRLVRQVWQRPQPSEAKRLGMRPNQIALLREVELLCFGEPWVFARSVFPLHTFNRQLRYLKGLGNQSLGSLLFKDPHLKRTLFEINRKPISAPGILEPAVCAGTLWGRRSLFLIQGKPILVAEYFLPRMQQKLLSLQNKSPNEAPSP